MKVKVKVKVKTFYDIEIEGKLLTGFELESSWNGLSKFKKGENSIILHTDGLDSTLAKMMDGEFETTAIIASPDLIHKAMKTTRCKTEETPGQGGA